MELTLRCHYNMDYWRDLCAECDFETEHQLVSGGITRFDTVKNSWPLYKTKA